MTKRAGRPRKPAVARKPCGRIAQPTPRQHEEASTAAAIRGRINHGATPANATDQAHATTIGRLYLAGRLGPLQGLASERTRDRYQAGIWYAGLHRAMRRAIEARDPFVHSAMGGTSSGNPEEVSAADCLRAIQRHRDAERAIPLRTRAAAFVVLIQEPEDAPAHFLAPLQIALDALNALRNGRQASQDKPTLALAG